MKKILFSILLTILFILSGQAQENQKVLNRIFLGPVESEILEQKAYFESFPETLFSLITIRQPVIRVDVIEDAHSVIVTKVEKKDENSAVLRFSIIKEEKIVDEAMLEFPITPLPLKTLQTFLKNTSVQFARNLGPALPLVRVTSLVQNEELRNTIRNIDFAEKMIMPFEISFSYYILQKMPAPEGGGPGMMPIFSFPVLKPSPATMYLDFTWFFAPNHGINFSFYFEYNRTVFRCRDDGGSVDSDAICMLIGGGYTFQTLGRFQATFGASFGIGAVVVWPSADIQNSTPETVYLAGVPIPIFMSELRLKMMVTYNFTENFGVFLRTGMQMNIIELILMNVDKNGNDLELSPYFGRFEAIGVGVLLRF